MCCLKFATRVILVLVKNWKVNNYFDYRKERCPPGEISPIQGKNVTVKTVVDEAVSQQPGHATDKAIGGSEGKVKDCENSRLPWCTRKHQG